MYIYIVLNIKKQTEYLWDRHNPGRQHMWHLYTHTHTYTYKTKINQNMSQKGTILEGGICSIHIYIYTYIHTYILTYTQQAHKQHTCGKGTTLEGNPIKAIEGYAGGNICLYKGITLFSSTVTTDSNGSIRAVTVRVSGSKLSGTFFGPGSDPRRNGKL
jgi:hypothetical protein